MLTSADYILEALVLVLAKQLEGTTGEPTDDSIFSAIDLIRRNKDNISQLFK